MPEANPILRVPVLLWIRMILDLRRRGGGRRESGAFLLGRRRGGQHLVERYVCYDDVDAMALATGIVVLRRDAFSILWAECKRLGLQVLADVHTHGNDYPVQSETDRVNPMISQSGHIALILPRFAGTWGWRFKNVAIYEYLGGYRWKDLRGKHRRSRVRFRWY